jgi:hypothetical protein
VPVVPTYFTASQRFDNLDFNVVILGSLIVPSRCKRTGAHCQQPPRHSGRLFYGDEIGSIGRGNCIV